MVNGKWKMLRRTNTIANLLVCSLPLPLSLSITCIRSLSKPNYFYFHHHSPTTLSVHSILQIVVVVISFWLKSRHFNKSGSRLLVDVGTRPPMDTFIFKYSFFTTTTTTTTTTMMTMTMMARFHTRQLSADARARKNWSQVSYSLEQCRENGIETNRIYMFFLLYISNSTFCSVYKPPPTKTDNTNGDHREDMLLAVLCVIYCHCHCR